MTDRKLTEMELRVAAVRATLARFKGKPLRFGTNDCVRMAAFHLRKMGHKVKLPPSGSYASIRSGERELSARGFATLAEAVDSLGLECIPPAAAVDGDLVELPSDNGLGCLTVEVGNGRVLGYYAGKVEVLQPLEWVRAWRVVPAAYATAQT
ncbi:hypothetical protein PQ455_01440 [Sphingomonas naphthae]|uniref:DUF6950 domain-containing protein n=1 Tax=Sphingomonas naphthae TaxID=1813468 RepID=A0ABY7TL80_9SPHN|nr:hypothetical protein [Sphingomonas naphthae]WCT73924.1 hypothetical protein PQ455_01440 [Sphingomonas naphthae]